MRAAVLLILALAGCAQPPSREIEQVASRIAEVELIEGALYAPQSLEESKAALAEAERLMTEEGDYLESIRAAARARARADDAYVEASAERQLVARHVGRLLQELQGLIDIARSRGADRDAREEFLRFEERGARVRELAETGDFMAALAEGESLKPELIDFEMRFR